MLLPTIWSTAILGPAHRKEDYGMKFSVPMLIRTDYLVDINRNGERSRMVFRGKLPFSAIGIS